MIKKFGKVFFISTLLAFPVSAQIIKSSSAQEKVVNIRDEKQNGKIEIKNSNDPPKKREPPTRRLSFIKHKRSKEQQKRLLPDTKDATRYAAFLREPKTGIIKLADDIGCNADPYVVRADEECLDTIPGGSFYSFRERDYSSAALADLRLRNGLLITDGIYSQNILVTLGDVALENISLNSNGMNFLTEFIPETEGKKATKQYIGLTKGIKDGKFEYVKVFPAFVNTTYAMRLVAYKGKVMMRLYNGFLYNFLSDDDRSDVILAFRIIRKEKDGITLVWKELERKKAPKIVNSLGRKNS